MALVNSEVSALQSNELSTNNNAIPNSLDSVLVLSSISESSIDHYTSEEIPKVLNDLQTFLITKYSIRPEHILSHAAMIVKRAATISTSMEARLVPGSHISYDLKTSDGTVLHYKLEDTVVFGYIRTWKDEVSNPNPVRKLRCTLEILHEWLAHKRPEIYETKRTTKLGLPKGKAYLGADFLSGNVSTLSEHDRAILLRSSEVALNRPSKSPKVSLTSLYDMVKEF
ncbi:CPm [Strawberry chlorotic fleck-associated virus]|uniref:CPm n=1 Tax=Strawberry chlorotic fleck-associated virus TaxID=399314 RepID=Q0GK49_9CLOS|nr:CPm [Strawberry chlorotic fleck-associated virus]ABI23187.1 CPm [Strawberry chlorotic fleck-associated virus]